MRITKLKLVNCGLHDRVEFACDSPIVGVCGVNGSGKSTVLEMVRYALTGETYDNIDTYVKHGNGNGSVELTFRKNGQEHTIFRQFGKSPRRVLKSGNATPLTKVKDIDVFMASLLGADRLAMNSAVFIGQGKLKEMLFSGDTDRRSLFIKLVNLGFCASRSDAASQLMGEVGQQVANLEPVLVSAEELLKLRETELAQVLTACEGLRDWTPELVQVNERQRLGGQRDETALQLQQATLSVQLRRSQLEERYPQILTVEDYYQQQVAANEELRQQRKALSEQLQRRTRLAGEFRRHRELAEQQRQLADELGRLTKELEKLPAAQQLTEQIQQINQQINEQQRYSADLKRCERLRLQLSSDQEKQPQVRDVLAKVDQELTLRKARQENVTEALRLAQERFAFGRELRRCFKAEGRVDRATCPKCSLTVVDINIPSEDDLDRMTEAVNQARQELTQANAALAALEKQGRLLVLEDSGLTVAIRNHQAELVQLEARLAQLTFDASPDRARQLTQELAYVTTQQGLRIQFETSLQQTQSSWRQVMQAQLALVEWKSEPVVSLQTAALQQLAEQITECEEQLRKDSARLQDMAAHLSAWKAATEQQEKLQLRLAELELQLSQALLPDLELLLQEHRSLTAVKVLLEDHQTRWNEAGQRKAGAEAARQAAQNQVTDIQRRMDQDRERRLVMRDLALIKELFADGGLPATVVGHYFRQLGFVTQRHLQSLNANFRIELDNQRPLTFCFERLDKPEGILPMHKLSGGQKVRLCLAFLMAVQEILVPDVGLLVLDEVNDSLDDEGVESLAELFKSMAGKLQNADHQLWIVAHRHEIANVLPIKLELKAP